MQLVIYFKLSVIFLCGVILAVFFYFKELPNELLHHFLHFCLFISYPLALLSISACYFCCNFCFLKHKTSIFEFRAYVIYQNLEQLWTSDWCQVGRSHVRMLELDHEESWAPKNWCFWKVWRRVEKTLESPLDCKEIKPVKPKGNPSWICTGRTDAETEAPTVWSLDVKNWLIGKDPDAGKDWR